jgi:hypothetical protein
MKDGYRRRESWETRDCLDNMVERGMRQFRRRAELSSGWKKAGIGMGIAAISLGAVLGFGYLKNTYHPGGQTVVEQNNGNVYSSFLMVNNNVDRAEHATPESEERPVSMIDLVFRLMRYPFDSSSLNINSAMTSPGSGFSGTTGYQTGVCRDGYCTGSEDGYSCSGDCGSP